jgi:hypothetical protein
MIAYSDYPMDRRDCNSFPLRGEKFVSSETFRPESRMGTGSRAFGAKSVLSSPCSDKVKNEWSYTSALLCLRDVHRKALNVGSKQIAADPIRH